jgi:hypothetical protein
MLNVRTVLKIPFSGFLQKRSFCKTISLESLFKKDILLVDNTICLKRLKKPEKL